MAQRTVILPTDEEDAEINRGIAADPDTFEATEEWFAQARPGIEVCPEIVAAQEAGQLRRRGERGKQKAPTKEKISVRLDADVMAALRATGPGWQNRLNHLARVGLRLSP